MLRMEYYVTSIYICNYSPVFLIIKEIWYIILFQTDFLEKFDIYISCFKIFQK